MEINPKLKRYINFSDMFHISKYYGDLENEVKDTKKLNCSQTCQNDVSINTVSMSV